MPLTTLQMALMSRLLDEALPLDESGRRSWLEKLSPEYADISQALREALLPDAEPSSGGAHLGILSGFSLSEFAGGTANSPVLLFVTRKFNACPASFSPALIAVAQVATVCAPASSSTVWSAPLVKLGAWFTAVTVIVKVCAALVSTPPFSVPPSSCNCTVTVAWKDGTLIASDALPGWKFRIEPGRALFRWNLTRGLRLPPGTKIDIGWLRYDRTLPLTLQVSESSPTVE